MPKSCSVTCSTYAALHSPAMVDTNVHGRLPVGRLSNQPLAARPARRVRSDPVALPELAGKVRLGQVLEAVRGQRLDLCLHLRR